MRQGAARSFHVVSNAHDFGQGAFYLFEKLITCKIKIASAKSSVSYKVFFFMSPSRAAYNLNELLKSQTAFSGQHLKGGGS